MTKSVALDIGTTKFCLAVLDRKDPLNPTVKISSIQARGMRRGMLSDFGQVTEGLTELLETSERKFKFPIREVIIGVAGAHLGSFHQKIHHKLNQDIISKNLLDTLQNNAKQLARIQGREVLHAIPIDYRLDGRSPVTNPIKLSANEIDARYFIIDADQLYLRDLIAAINEAGMEVSRIYAEPYASAAVTVPSIAKELGIVVCDIGGGTTDGIIYQQGQAVECLTLDIGGIMMTNDIAICLKIPLEEAEKAKNFFGLSSAKSGQVLQVTNTNGQVIELKGVDVQKVLWYRVAEWSKKLADKLAPYRGKLGAGILLTGGGSMIIGLSNILAKQYQLPVNVSLPTLKNASGEDKYAVNYATAVGLLSLEEAHRQKTSQTTTHWRIPLFSQLSQWIKDFS